MSLMNQYNVKPENKPTSKKFIKEPVKYYQVE